MRITAEYINRIKTGIELIEQRFREVPDKLKHRARPYIQKCSEYLSKIPGVDTPVHIHIIGTDKSFKTSYLLDLFENNELRDLFEIKLHNTSENTAVPCLIKPEEVDRIVIQKISISSGEVMEDNLSSERFRRLYDLGAGARPGDYMLRLLIPVKASKMSLPVIEYPGIKKGADSSREQVSIHETSNREMIQSLRNFPGILVACFYDKIFIPEGHPIDSILNEYVKHLQSDNKRQKPPLVLSLQGERAVSSYCGNTNVMQDIEKDFHSYRSFDTKIQLVNPYNRTYPVTFGKVGPHVEEWIRELSNYDNVFEIYQVMEKDGGISWSRNFLETISRYPYIREALDNIYLRPWIEESETFLNEALSAYDEISSYDTVSETHNRIKEKLTLSDGKFSYQTIRDCFQEVSDPEVAVEMTQKELWEKVFLKYLIQFFDHEDECKDMAAAIWEKLLDKLDADRKGFITVREDDVPYIILNVAEMYVPNALLRGDAVIYGHIK